MRGVLLVLVTACSAEPHEASRDAAVVPVERIDESGLCNPMLQQGCDAGKRCTWFWDQLPVRGQSTPLAFGHNGCAAGGTLALGASCTPRTLGADACAPGLLCETEQCRLICDPNMNIPSPCTAEQQCVTSPGLYELTPGTFIAGVCKSP